MNRLHWLPDPQPWAVQHERDNHSDALYGFGEYAVFVLMWQITDFKEGLVQRCPLCYDAFDKVAAAYGQSAQTKCQDCYGTTFEGGYKAILVRPSIWDATEENVLSSKTGEYVAATATVQSTEDFLMNGGDYIFRVDGTRWECAGPVANSDYLHTGFQYAGSAAQAVGFNYQRIVRADDQSVAYIIPPPPGAAESILSTATPRTPTDFSAVEEIRGPLL